MISRWYKSFEYSDISIVKIAEEISQEGHWRTLPSHHKGKDRTGSPLTGKTWVRKGRMKSWFKPYPTQKKFIDKVERLPQGGGIIAGHGTGSGKTAASIAAFENLKDKGRAKRALVIVPASLRNNFLESGINKFTDSKGVIVQNASRDVGEEVEYVITSYAAFRRNPKGFLDKYKPDTIIADEMHRAVNPNSSTHKTLKWAQRRVNTFMGLTASVVQNDPSDVAALNAIASRERNPTTDVDIFKRRYQRKVPTGRRSPFGGKATPETHLIRQEEIAHYLSKTIDYVEDLDAGKKPKKISVDIPVDMTPQQVSIYKRTMKGMDPKIRAKIAAGEPVTQSEASRIFKRIIDARRVSNSLHQHVPGMSLEEAAEKTPKIKKILNDVQIHMKVVPDAQVIIYSNLVEGGVDVISAGLKKRGIPYGIFSGARKDVGVTKESRQQAVKDYKSGKNKVIIITSAGAEGLDLGNTTMVMIADPHFNPERTSQAVARGIRAEGLSHRPKEKRKVIVRRYVSKIPRNFWQRLFSSKPEKGIDEWVYSIANRKERATRQLRNVMDRNNRRRG